MRMLAIFVASAFLFVGLAHSQCLDCDGDGFNAPLDCDDTNASVYPAAPEQCDNLDNDCDGDIDIRPCATECNEGSEYCWDGNWVTCSAPPCCDAYIGPGGDYEDLCPAAADTSSPTTPTLCVLPGTYSTPCKVAANLVGVEGSASTIISGDLITISSYSGSIWGLSIQGGLVTGAHDHGGGASVFDSVVTGFVTIHGHDEDRASSAIGNRFDNGMLARDAVLLRRNLFVNGGIQDGGDSGGPIEILENRIVQSSLAILADHPIGANIARNTIENCDVGIIWAPEFPPLRPVEHNLIQSCRIGIQMWGFGTARNNVILNARDYGILMTNGFFIFNFAQNLVLGTGSDPMFPGLGIGIGVIGVNGPGSLSHNAVAMNEIGFDLVWLQDDPGDVGDGFRASNNIAVFNRLVGVSLDNRSLDPIVLSHNDVYGNGEEWSGVSDPTGIDGNISADPLFVDPDRDLYGLRPDSPCIDAGGASTLPVDIVGSPRTVDGDRDGIAVTDIGAYEFVPTNPRGLGFWKHQCSDKPFRQLSPDDLEQLFTTIAALSPAFPECAIIGCQVLEVNGPQDQMRAKVEKQLIGVWLNVGSQRLLLNTPIDLASMTTGKTVSDAIDEIEAALCDPGVTRSELEMAKDLGEALNLGDHDFELAGDISNVRVMPGMQRSFTLGLINMSSHPQNYDLHVSGPWPAVLAITQVNGLQPGEVALIPVHITVPRYAAFGEKAEMKVRATERVSGVPIVRDASIILSVVEVEGPRRPILLP